MMKKKLATVLTSAALVLSGTMLVNISAHALMTADGKIHCGPADTSAGCTDDGTAGGATNGNGQGLLPGNPGNPNGLNGGTNTGGGHSVGGVSTDPGSAPNPKITGGPGVDTGKETAQHNKAVLACKALKDPAKVAKCLANLA